MDPFAGPPEKRRAFDDAGQNGVQRDRTCKRFDTAEGCPFGDRCRFSHGPDDPRKLNCIFEWMCEVQALGRVLSLDEV